MTIKNTFIIIIVIMLSACGAEKTPKTSVQEKSIYVLFENGGTIANDEQAFYLNSVYHLLHQLSKNSTRKANKHTKIYIILSANPNVIAWSGYKQDLRAQSEEIKSILSFKQGFSDLAMAFNKIKTTVNLSAPEDVKIYWIGNTVHVPFQNTANASIEITVPQMVPELVLPEFIDMVSSLKIYGVHPDQQEPLNIYFQSNGILQRAKDGKLELSVLGQAETKAMLSNLL